MFPGAEALYFPNAASGPDRKEAEPGMLFRGHLDLDPGVVFPVAFDLMQLHGSIGADDEEVRRVEGRGS